jgi:hypothetical protein
MCVGGMSGEPWGAPVAMPWIFGEVIPDMHHLNRDVAPAGNFQLRRERQDAGDAGLQGAQWLQRCEGAQRRLRPEMCIDLFVLSAFAAYP